MSNLETALQSIKRIGSFSESEKDALRKAFRKSMFPGDWEEFTSPNHADVLTYDQISDTWGPATASGSTFLSLSDTPSGYDPITQFFVRVNAGGNGLDFTDAKLEDLSNVSSLSKLDGVMIQWNQGFGQWSYVNPSSADVDSVNTYTGVVVLDIDDVTPTTTKGDLIVEDGSNAIRLGIGTDTHVLVADSGEATGMKWAANPAGFTDPMTTRGDVIIRDSGNTTARLGIGANTFVLTSDGTDIAWAASIAGVSAFLGLSDVPASYSGQANKYVVVNGAANALEFTSVSPVTQVTGTSPIISSGGTTPAMSIQVATAAQHGYMSLTYANKLDNIENNADVTDATNVEAAGAWIGTVTVSSSAPSGGNDGDIWFEIP